VGRKQPRANPGREVVGLGKAIKKIKAISAPN
jgi:hypothetical protein